MVINMKAYVCAKKIFFAFLIGFFPGLALFFLITVTGGEFLWPIEPIFVFLFVSYLLTPCYVSIVMAGFAVGRIVNMVNTDRKTRKKSELVFNIVMIACAAVLGGISLWLFKPDLRTVPDILLILPLVAMALCPILGVGIVVFWKDVPQVQLGEFLRSPLFWVTLGLTAMVIPVSSGLLDWFVIR